jgi:hypothetical protein
MKKIFTNIYILYSKLSMDNFKLHLMYNLQYNSHYTILFKLCDPTNDKYKIAGPQLGFHYIDSEIEILYKHLMARIDFTASIYSYTDDPKAIQLICKQVVNATIKPLVNIDKIKLNKPFANVVEIKKLFNSEVLPLTTDINRYGRLLLNSEKSEIITKINKYNNVQLTMKDNLYLYKSKISGLESKETILNIQKFSNTQLITFYSIEGFWAGSIKDTILDANINRFMREINKMKVFINNNQIEQVENQRDLSPITYKIRSHVDRNTNLGSFDLEVYKDNGINKVYAIGYYTNSMKEPNLFYLTDVDKKLDSDKLILTCLDSMLQKENNNTIFYAHNFGNFDFIFIYNIIKKANQFKQYEYYKTKLLIREDNILKLTIGIQLNNTSIQIHFVDSLNLLNSSLDILCKDFGLDNHKTYFPYNFVNRNTLSYIGNTPDIIHYPKLDINNTDDIKIYNKLIKKDWDLRIETLNYLSMDLQVLLEIMNIFSERLHIEYNLELTNTTTISGLAINLYFQKYYFRLKKNIPYIKDKSLYNFIKNGYYGGLTEVYKPYGKNLVYLDVNSLYPWAALKPMPGLKSTFMENFKSEDGLPLKDLFGFFFAEVITNKQYFGLLPIKTQQEIIYPQGKLSGVWSSEELKFAAENGYKVKVLYGVHFSSQESPFRDYVFDLYTQKNSATGANRLIFKSLLNNLIGRFGLNIQKPLMEEVDINRWEQIAKTNVITSHIPLYDDKYFISYFPDISKEICLQHGIDFTEEWLKNIKKPKINNFMEISVVIPAMVNSYARIFMNSIKLDILKQGGNIFYMDTDSLVVDQIGFNWLKENNFIGKELGKFKVEHFINEAYFISNKTYCLLTNNQTSKNFNNNVIIKAKGVIKNSLSIEDFLKLYNNVDISAIRQNTKSSITDAYVDISKQNIKLRASAYTKREKLYSNDHRWIDTKPLEYNSE